MRTPVLILPVKGQILRTRVKKWQNFADVLYGWPLKGGGFNLNRVDRVYQKAPPIGERLLIVCGIPFARARTWPEKPLGQARAMLGYLVYKFGEVSESLSRRRLALNLIMNLNHPKSNLSGR